MRLCSFEPGGAWREGCRNAGSGERRLEAWDGGASRAATFLGGRLAGIPLNQIRKVGALEVAVFQLARSFGM